jgi:phage-related tail fiber protein
MIDANSQFFAILTNVGMAKQANADALGVPWKFTHMGVGDANDTDPIPNATQTSLIREWRRRPLNQVRVDPVNPAVIIAEQIIPADEGGFWIREIGLYDADGDLVAVANCAPSFKPVLSQGSGRTQVVRMNFIVASTGNITLKIDPAVVLATREYVDQRIQEELYKLDSKQSVLVATTANIALAGLQTIDGVAVPAGARVLVKNQTVAKDNGIYIAAAPAWTRAPDADTNAEVTSALLTSVEQGATLADTRWQLVTDGLIVVGTTALTFQNVTQGFAPINTPALISPTANTPGQFDSSQLLVNSAFVRRQGLQYSGFLSLAVNTALTLAEVGGLVSFSSASMLTCTLPATNTIPATASAIITVACAGNGGLTVSPAAGGDTVNTSTGAVGSIVMALGETAEFIRLGGQWRLIGGTVAVRYAVATLPLFDDTEGVATTKFIRRASGNYRGFTNAVAAATLTTGAVGTLVTTIGEFTLTMPAVNAVPSGGAIHFRNIGNGVVTVVCAGADAINAGNGNQPTSIALYPGATLELAGNGANAWWASGSAQLQFAKVLGFTPPQFDASKLLVNAEFLQRALGNLSGMSIYTANAALVVTDFGRIVLANSALPVTLTLPAIGSVPTGSTIYIRNVGSSPATVVPPAGGSMSVIATVNIPSVVLQPGASLMATVQGNNYFLDGSASLKHTTDFGASLTGPNCYQKLPGGDIEQWGVYVSAPSGSETVITLSVGMLAAPTGVELTFADQGSSLGVGQSPTIQVRAVAAGSITVRNLYTSSVSFYWKVRGRV